MGTLQFLAMCTDWTQRRLCYQDFMLKMTMLVYIVCSLASTNPCSEENINEPVRVSRRLDGDYVWSESESNPCSCTNLTYLVDERQCVNNQDLLNGT